LPDCLAALGELEQVIDDKAGDDGPSFRTSREAIEQVSDMVQRFVRGSGAPAEAKPAQSAKPAPNTSTSANTAPVAPAAPPATADATPGEIHSRHEALEQLRQVAIFFRRTEPQSPVAYLADQAAKWGEMPL